MDHARRLQYNVAGTTALEVGYIEDPEVDIALNLGPRWLLLEAKYRSKPRSNLEKAGHKGDLRIIATRDRFELANADGTHKIPAHEFALLC